MQLFINRLLLGLLLVYAAGCAPGYSKYIQQYRTGATDSLPQYSNLYYWAAHPWKKDPSDSVPLPLQESYRSDSTIDVFFIHPTTFTDWQSDHWNADIRDAALNAKTDYAPILYQASAFNTYRVFAPRYRQANIKAYFTRDTARAIAAFNTAYEDVKTAFQYYLSHFNQGRPIIIVSHSQGSTHAQRLLKDFFENRPLQQQLVAAYVVGMYIPASAFTALQPCTDSLQTGCICGWRTFKKNYEPGFVLQEKGACVVTNPLTWTTGTGYASNTLNRGAVLRSFNNIKKYVAGAEIHDRVLWVGKIHLPGGFLIRRKNFHIADINLFYLNIRQNINSRVARYRSLKAAGGKLIQEPGR